MGRSITTIVIEPRALVREALVSLMESHSFAVTGSFATTADIEYAAPAGDAPRLVIFGTLAANDAASAAGAIRKRWPESKIILLVDRATSSDFQRLLASELDGCIPLFTLPDALVGTLKRIVAGDLRIMMVKTEPSSMTCATGLQAEQRDVLGVASHGLTPSNDMKIDSIDRTSSLRIIHGLSAREEEILKSVVRGHSNKMIARTCGVTDATVKVHMKSILRKIRVANRTQAAIWALEQGFGKSAEDASVHRPTEALGAP